MIGIAKVKKWKGLKLWQCCGECDFAVTVRVPDKAEQPAQKAQADIKKARG